MTGGVSSFQDAGKFIQLGVERLGISRNDKIVKRRIQMLGTRERRNHYETIVGAD